jgi:hypothetical protein
MSTSGVKNLELSLRADKKRAEQAMEKAIYTNVDKIVEAMVTEAEAGSYQHGAYLLDRAFGKTKQSLDIESQGQPIVFMPSALIAKFGLDKPVEAPLVEEPNVYSVE